MFFLTAAFFITAEVLARGKGYVFCEIEAINTEKARVKLKPTTYRLIPCLYSNINSLEEA